MWYRNIYFIDTENVNADFTYQLPKLRASDMIYLFWSDNSCKLNMEQALLLHDAKCIVRQSKSYRVDKNALDFQLICALGRQVEHSPKSKFYIISDDTGYDAAIDYLLRDGIFVKRISMMSSSLVESKLSTSKKEEVKIPTDLNTPLKLLTYLHTYAKSIDITQYSYIWKCYKNGVPKENIVNSIKQSKDAEIIIDCIFSNNCLKGIIKRDKFLEKMAKEIGYIPKEYKNNMLAYIFDNINNLNKEQITDYVTKKVKKLSINTLAVNQCLSLYDKIYNIRESFYAYWKNL